MRKPCSNCPWRVDAPRQYWDPQHFVDIWRNCQDDGLNLMMCHKANNLPKGTPSTEMPICQGWVRVMGFDAIGVRIAAMHGRITLQEVHDTKSVELFPTFEAMLRANDIPIVRRNRWGDDVIDVLKQSRGAMKAKAKSAQFEDITNGSRWKNRRNKRIAEVVIGFRADPPISLYVLESRKASRDDGDDAYEEIARNERAKKQQIMYRYVKKAGRHVATCAITAEKFLAAFTPT